MKINYEPLYGQLETPVYRRTNIYHHSHCSNKGKLISTTFTPTTTGASIVILLWRSFFTARAPGSLVSCASLGRISSF
jgi:hypothetical protein